MTNTEAAFVVKEHIRTYMPCAGLLLALQRAITALEHFPELTSCEHGKQANQSCKDCQRQRFNQQAMAAGVTGLECNVCHWRTLDTHRLLCDSCGGHELKPVYEVSNNGQAKD